MHERLAELLNNAGIPDVEGQGTTSESSNSGGATGQDSASTRAIQEATLQIRQLQIATQGSVDSLTANTDALTQSAQSHSSSSAASMATSLGGDILSGGILNGGILGGGLSLLFDGIKSLFGGGPSQPASLTQYVPPNAQNFELASSQGSTGDAVYDSYSQPREAAPAKIALDGIQPTNWNSTGPSAGGSLSGQNAAGAMQQVTVQVQAMDSRSFLDHSSDIASAVREAMLNMHSINDVVNDL